VGLFYFYFLLVIDMLSFIYKCFYFSYCILICFFFINNRYIFYLLLSIFIFLSYIYFFFIFYFFLFLIISFFCYPRNDLNVYDIISINLKFILSTNSSTRICFVLFFIIYIYKKFFSFIYNISFFYNIKYI